MSTKNKRKNLTSMDDTESSSSDEDVNERHPDAYTTNEEVQIDFEGRAPSDPDSFGIAQLLSRLFLKAPVNCLEMAELIIGQNFIGSVICQCESDVEDSDDDICEDGTIFGISTVLNITSKKDVPCIQQLRKYIIDRAEKHAPDAVLTHFRNVLDNDSSSVGFLINERFINIPPQISVPLLESLDSEIQKAMEKGMHFDMTYFLVFVKFYRKEAKKGKPAEDTFTNAEEEILCAQATNSFEFSVANECDSGMSGDWLEGDAILTPYRKLLLLDAKQFPKLISEIKKFIEGF